MMIENQGNQEAKFQTNYSDHNMIISNEPIEEFNDALSQSLSEGYITLETLKKAEMRITPRNHSALRSQRNTQVELVPNTIPPQAQDEQIAYQSPLQQQKCDITFLQKSLFKDVTAVNKNSDTPILKFTKQGSCIQDVGHNLMQMFHLRKFIEKLLVHKTYFNKIGVYHFNLINDKASNFSQHLVTSKAFTLNNSFVLKRMLLKQQDTQIVKLIKQGKTKINQIWGKLIYLESQLSLIYPELKQKILWDTLLALVRFYFMLMIPLELAFNQQFLYSRNIFPVTLVLTLFLVIDLLLSFNTAYYEFGSMVMDRSKIFTYRISKSWGLEFFSVIFLFILLFIDPATIAETIVLQIGFLTFFTQFHNITSLIRHNEEVLNLSKPQSSMLELGKLILTVMYLLHVYSCLWFWCGNYSNTNLGQSWLHKFNLMEAGWEIQYLYSFYYSTVTMFTVGYGDITPQSKLEIIFAIAFMMICSIQLSYSVNTVGAIIDRISMYNERKLRKIQIINSYMQKNKINYQLQYEIREYLNYYWQSEQSVDTDEQGQIINQLSEKLREKLMIESHSAILNICPLFKNYFSPNVIQKLVKKMLTIAIQPENVINFDKINAKTTLDSNIFLGFIEEGKIQVIFQKVIFSSMLIMSNHQSMNPSQRFILMGNHLIQRVLQLAQLGKENTEVLVLLNCCCSQEMIFSKFKLFPEQYQILKEFPEDWQKFNQLKDSLFGNQTYEVYDTLKLKCGSCYKIGHHILDCPVFQYRADKEKIIKTHQFTRQQTRNEKRVRRQRFKNMFVARIDQHLIQEMSDFIQNDLWKDTLVYESGQQKTQQNDSSSSDTSSNDSRKIRQNKVKGLAASYNFGATVNPESKYIRRPQLSHSNIRSRKQTQQLSIISNERRKTMLQKQDEQKANAPRLSNQLELGDVLQLQQQVETSNNVQIKSFAFAEDITNEQSAKDSQNFLIPISESNTGLGLKSAIKKRPSVSVQCMTEIPLSKTIISNDNNSNNNSSHNIEERRQSEKLQKVKVKFQKALEFVAKMNIVKKTMFKQKNNFDIEETMLHKLQVQDRLFKWNQFNQIAQKLTDKKELLSHNQGLNLELLKIQLQVELNDKQEIENFETIKQYKFYFKAFNLSEVLKNYEFFLEDANQVQYKKIFSDMVKYIQFPFVFINQYKKTSTQPVKKKTKQKKMPSPPLAKKLLIYKDLLKIRTRVKEKLKNRNKVTPQKE